MPATYNKGYPVITPFYEDADRVGGGRGDYIDRSDYAWNAESMMGESNSAMAVHSVVIGVVGLGAMKLYGQETDVAVKHSAILAGIAFIYMGLFGHGLPDKLRGPFLKGDSDE